MKQSYIYYIALVFLAFDLIQLFFDNAGWS